MGSKLRILLGRTSRQMSKLKILLGLTISRVTVLRNHRQARCNHARGDVAQLLQLGHVDRALLRVEDVIREQDMLVVFEMMEQYCHLLLERATLLDHKECPEELREAISSLIFAASRCAELPELDKSRDIFSSRYGKEFVSASVELRNNCSVNPKMIQKLSTRQPSLEIRQIVTKEIAAEKGINLEFHEPSSEIVEGNSMVNPPTILIQEQFESDENPSLRTHHKYNDVASAAQAAFESAAFAAAAARAAVDLCRSESQGKGKGKGSGDENKGGSQRSSEIKETKRVDDVENSADRRNFEKIQHDQNHSSDSEEGTKAKQDDLLQKERFREKFVKQLQRSSSSSSDSTMEENNTVLNEQRSEGSRGKNVLFDKSDDDEAEKDGGGLGRKQLYASHEERSPGGRTGRGVQLHRQFDASLADESPHDMHRIPYFRPPCEENNNSLQEETDKVGLRSGTEGKSAMYNKAENTYLYPAGKMRQSNPMSVRTRR